MKVLTAAFFLLAHAGYPPDCCENQHCHPVPCDEISMSTTGNMMWNGMAFSPGSWRTSPDGRCHVCNQGKLPLCIMPGGTS